MADENDTEEEGGGGGKKKLLFIIVGVVVLLLIAGAAAYFLMGGDEEEGEEGEKAAQEEQAPPPEEGEPLYITLGDTFVVTLPPGGKAKMAQIAIDVYTRHAEVKTFLDTNAPMIRHHMLNLLEGQTADALMTAEGKQALQQAILDLLTEKMEEMKQQGEIKAIYFTQFVLQ